MITAVDKRWVQVLDKRPAGALNVGPVNVSVIRIGVNEDATNPDPEYLNRAQVRFIAASQPTAGAMLDILSILTLRAIARVRELQQLLAAIKLPVPPRDSPRLPNKV